MCLETDGLTGYVCVSVLSERLPLLPIVRWECKDVRNTDPTL